MALERKYKAVWTVVGWEVDWLPFFLCSEYRKSVMGLQMLLQIGITKYGNRNYTFGVFGGRIEGEGKGWF